MLLDSSPGTTILRNGMGVVVCQRCGMPLLLRTDGAIVSGCARSVIGVGSELAEKKKWPNGG